MVNGESIFNALNTELTQTLVALFKPGGLVITAVLKSDRIEYRCRHLSNLGVDLKEEQIIPARQDRLNTKRTFY